MDFSDISIWGVLLVVVLSGVALAFCWLVDRRSFNHSVRALVSLCVQLVLSAVYVWGLYSLDNWMVNLLWLLIMSLVVAYVSLGRTRLPWVRFLPVLTLSVMAGCLVAGGSMLLAVSDPDANQLFIPVMSLLLGELFAATTVGLRTYLISLRYTKIHRMYIQANGGTHLESLMPSVRRAVRAALMPQLRNMASPILLALPMFLCGMLAGGAEVGTAFVVTLLIALSAFSSTILTVVLAIWLSDRYLFDKYGNLIV